MHNVLVTGGSRGIGLAIARRLATAGYNVIAVARRESDELRDAIEAAVKQGRGGLRFRACDLSEIDAIPAFVKSVRDEFGAIYGLVNNAGTSSEGLLATMHNSQIEALLRLNVLSPVILTKYVIAGRSALRRLPETEDVARMVEYLLGDGGRNVTGTVLTIDAGNTA
jgi:3-oxoacyl-[acyl-carrier protein] reductase